MEDEFYYSTETELDNAEAHMLGEMYPERAWVVTDRDVVHKNPFYQGPPVPHPDDQEYEMTPKQRARQIEVTEEILREIAQEDAAFRAAHPSGMQPWEETINPDEIPF